MQHASAEHHCKSYSSFSLNMTCVDNCSHRWMMMLILLFLNPLTVIDGAALKSIEQNLQSVPRQQAISFHKKYSFSPEEENHHQSFLGCKYDLDLCNANELCLDGE